MSTRLLTIGLSIIVAGCPLLGCASAPDRQAPDIGVSIPGDWTAGDSVGTAWVPADAQWWLSFSDPQLNALIQEVLTRNFNLIAAIARVDQAAAAARIAGAELFPNVSAGFQASRRQ
ncbi:MAG: TolC family protein, partial [Candidatus Latescibacterota bacterium]